MCNLTKAPKLTNGKDKEDDVDEGTDNGEEGKDDVDEANGGTNLLSVGTGTFLSLSFSISIPLNRI